MINFSKVDIKDRDWMQPLIMAGDTRGCHINFVNIFAWAGIYHYQVAKVNDFLVISGQFDEGQYYFYPVGKGDVKPVIDSMIQDSAERGNKFILVGLSNQNIEQLSSLYPNSFEYEEMRDSFDYIYSVEKLTNLSGKKLQSKRNHINRFKENNSNWSFEQITLDNLSQCFDMNLQWCKLNECEENEPLKNEMCAVKRCFKYFSELHLEGGLLRLDGKVIAFTMGDVLSSDTYDTHIEKAFGEIQGAYQMINQQFALFIVNKYPNIKYINREEDMGMDGLRKAKLSYKPDIMEEKYLARLLK